VLNSDALEQRASLKVIHYVESANAPQTRADRLNAVGERLSSRAFGPPPRLKLRVIQGGRDECDEG
jgi:hypothetical protein